MAEELTEHLYSKGFKIAYLHNELLTLERTKILNDLRRGKYDAVVGINLLREGIDIPEISLVLILDADIPGLFRSEKALIQMIGRAARNVNGKVILYANKTTPAMKNAISETNRRRETQNDFNIKFGITPKTIIKPIFDDIGMIKDKADVKIFEAYSHKSTSAPKEKSKVIEILRKEMLQAAKSQEYERAAYLRDKIIELEGKK
jgi:excinuclease ABC subunit B